MQLDIPITSCTLVGVEWDKVWWSCNDMYNQVTSLNDAQSIRGGAVTEQFAHTHTAACTAPTNNVITHVPDGFHGKFLYNPS
jgi:hypothetical protein